MRLLLDTHVFLWSVTGSPRLRANGRRLIEGATTVHVSAASLWEIAIKVRLGKLEADVGQLAEAIDACGFVELPVSSRHAAAVARLPAHHSDPFDRMLLAQAQVEPLRLVTADVALAAYGPGVEVL